MSDHALLAPSAAHRWMHCPGSVALCKDVERTDTVYSREGTFAHTVAAELLASGALASSAIGRKGDGFTFDREMAEAVQVYLSVVRKLMLTEGDELQIERKVTLSPNIYGTADALIWANDRRVLHVVDLKMGRGVLVEAEGNEQLMIYALAALNDYMISPHSMHAVHLHIVQPRYGSAAPHRSVEVSGVDLAEFNTLVAGSDLAVRDVLKTGNIEPDLHPGDHCRFCPKKVECPALQRSAMTTAIDLFDDLDPTKKPAVPPLLEQFSPAKLAQVLDNLGTVEAWVKAIREHAFDRAKRGEEIPGWKIVEKIGNRKWRNEDEAAKTLVNFGVDPWEKSIISPAQAEKQNKATKDVVKQLTTREVTGTVLVPASDKRPAIADVSAAFNVIENET